MYLMENIQLALEGLKSNKMRALLTMLGIIIGIGSVIAIVTVGDSMTASVSSSMQSLGATNIMVAVQKKDTEDPRQMAMGSQMSESDLISDEMIDQFMALYGDKVDAISLNASGGSGRVQDGRLYANISLAGVNDGYGKANNVDIMEGRFLREGDIKANRNVAVVSDKLVNNMFPGGEDPLAKEIKVSQGDSIQTFTIVGVYKYDQTLMNMMGVGSASDQDIRTDLYIPISTCNMITAADPGYSSLTVMAKSEVDSPVFARDIRDFFNVYYNNNTKYTVRAQSMETMMSTMTTMMGTLSIAIAVIAGISLVVGGVGVMNIMLVSVTERTREIGTRKALGARNASIRVQFIVEAVIICALGGIIGILAGISLGYMGSSLLGFPGFPTIAIIVIAVLFSMLIGVFFGYYPANKAARLDPIEALRYE